MNLFFLSVDPEECAQQHCDKHVVKMILELTQMLYTAHHVHKTPTEVLPIDCYRSISNIKHPTALWVRTSKENYNYTCLVAYYLSKEYTHRYSRVHSCDKHIHWLINNIPVITIIKDIDYSSKKFSYSAGFDRYSLTKIPLAMPEVYYSHDTIKSYREYYINEKKYFAKWTKRNVPYWFNDKISNLFK